MALELNGAKAECVDRNAPKAFYGVWFNGTKGLKVRDVGGDMARGTAI